MKNSLVQLSQEQKNNFKSVKLLIAHVLNYALSLRILTFLEENQGATVTEIYVAMREDQSVVSLRLGWLRRFDLVRTERNGKLKYYYFNTKRWEKVLHIMERLQGTDMGRGYEGRHER